MFLLKLHMILHPEFLSSWRSEIVDEKFKKMKYVHVCLYSTSRKCTRNIIFVIRFLVFNIKNFQPKTARFSSTQCVSWMLKSKIRILITSAPIIGQRQNRKSEIYSKPHVPYSKPQSLTYFSQIYRLFVNIQNPCFVTFL